MNAPNRSRGWTYPTVALLLALVMLGAVGAGVTAMASEASSAAASASGAPRQVGALPDVPSALASKLSAPSAKPYALPNGYAALAHDAVSGHLPTLAQFEAALGSTPNASAYVGAVGGHLSNATYTAAVRAMVCSTCAETVGGISFGIAALVCAVAGVESLGIACAAAIAGFVIATLVAYFFGSSAASELGQAAATIASTITNDEHHAYVQMLQGITQDLQALNLTQDALSYEAASAALLQIGATSFSGPLDLVASNVSEQLASTWATWGSQYAGINAGVANAFDVTLGTSDSTGYGCQGDDVSSGLSYGASTTGACGSTLNSGTYSSYPYGAMGSAMAIVMPTAGNAYIYLLHGESYSLQLTSSDSLSMENLADGTWANFSAPVATINGTWAGTTGPWELVAGSTYAQFDPSFSMVLDSATANYQETHGTYDGALQADYLPSGATNGLADNYGNFYSDTGGVQAGSALSNAPDTLAHSGAFDNALKYLWALASNAETTADSYWTFLHLLGYTSVAEIPKDCVILTPSQVLPPNLPVSELETMNATAVLDLYLTMLGGLGADYANATLDTATFCAHKLPQELGNTSVDFSIYGAGYLYEPSQTKNANGTASQSFASPTTWNSSGEVFIAPTLFSASIPTNETWELSNTQTYFAYVVPFGNAKGQVAATGPSSCVATGANCSLLNSEAYVLTQVIGNSSHENGQVYSSAITDTTAGNAVFFTVCRENPDVGTGNTWSGVGTCDFNVSSLTNVTGCGGQITQSGSGCGTTPPGFSGGGVSDCGQTLPLWSELVTGFDGFTAGFGDPALACGLAETFALIAIIVIVVVVAYVGVWTFRAVRGAGEQED